jgi:hypothetical protein
MTKTATSSEQHYPITSVRATLFQSCDDGQATAKPANNAIRLPFNKCVMGLGTHKGAAISDGNVSGMGVT